MNKRTNRRQRGRDRAIRQQDNAASARPRMRLAFKLPNNPELLQRIQEVFASYRLFPESPFTSLVDTGHLRNSFTGQLTAYEIVLEQESALLRARGLVAQLFEISPNEATDLVRRFCSERSVTPDRLYELLSANIIVLHPDRFLTLVPDRQLWIVHPHPQSALNSFVVLDQEANRSATIRVIRLETELDVEVLRPRTIIEFQILNERFHVSGEQLWIGNTLVLGGVVEHQMEAVGDGMFTHTLRLQIPVVEEEQEFEGHINQRRVLKTSEIEYGRMRLPNRPWTGMDFAAGGRAADSNLKVCADCKHYHGRSYDGEQGFNFLVCGMHPYGPENDECADWEG